MDSEKHILTSKIENWRLFARALREENRILFNQMLNECNDCVNSKGKGLAAESLFLILILEQQKMINELIAKLRASLLKPKTQREGKIFEVEAGYTVLAHDMAVNDYVSKLYMEGFAYSKEYPGTCFYAYAKSYIAALWLASPIMQTERNIAEGAKFSYIMPEYFVHAAVWRHKMYVRTAIVRLQYYYSVSTEVLLKFVGKQLLPVSI